MAYRNYSPVSTGFLVAKDGNGDFSTIATALTAAASGDTIYIKPGTYTENLTLVAGVNLCAFDCDSINNVIIKGKCTFTGAGTVSISGIQLQTNSDYALAVTGNSASIIYLNNCYLNFTNNTGIDFTSSSASATINITDCFGDLGTTLIAFFTHSSAGVLNMYGTKTTNSGFSVTASTISSTGSILFSNCDLKNQYTFSSSSQGTFNFCKLQAGNSSTVIVTTSGTSLCVLEFCVLASASAAAVSIGTGSSASLSWCIVNSSATNALTGAGTCDSYGVIFTSTSNASNVTTQAGGAASGLTQGTAPSAGFIGEQISSFIASASAVAVVTSLTYINVTSIALTAGVWDITVLAQGKPVTTGNFYICSISTSSAAAGTTGDSASTTITNATNGVAIPIPAYRVTLASTTTYYFNGTCNFSAGTPSIYGRMSAVRVG